MKKSLKEKQERLAGERFEARKNERARAAAALAEGRWQDVESLERVFQRAALSGRQDVLAKAMTEIVREAAPVAATAIVAPGRVVPNGLNPYERIIGKNELQPASFLFEGCIKLRSVGRVNVRSSEGSGYGTGFLVSRRLLMTNNHVLDSEETAAQSFVQFDFLEKKVGVIPDGAVFRFQPGVFFVTNGDLDFTLVAVEPVNSQGARLEDRGWSPFIADSGKVLHDDLVNIIQHPSGRPMELSIRENKVVDVLPDFIHYETDTEPGSSGSPVFNDLWQLAALHHSGVPIRDAQGTITGWKANEGVRISSTVRFIQQWAAGRSQTEQQLFQETFATPPGAYTALFERAQTSPVQPGEAAASSISVQPDGTARWTFPIHVSVAIGGSAPPMSGALPAPFTPSSSVAATPPYDVRRGILRQRAQDLLRAGEALPYYSKVKDEADAQQYYGALGQLPNNPQQAYTALRQLVASTHTTSVSYDKTRKTHLYPWVDLHQNGSKRLLFSIYSGKSIDPEELLIKEMEIEARIIGDEYYSLGPEAVFEKLQTLEAQSLFNCEHTVPQSWFNKDEPMRGDLHHLFTCESNCNSFRGNTPYFQFDPLDEVFRDDCGRREPGGAGPAKFEPAAGKGAVARATFYFLLRYPGKIGDVATELPKSRLNVLKQWATQSPPDLWEKHRNAAIFAVQGNRNPLIDRPEWLDKIDFAAGFGTP
jgi:endonuclease I/V8-like Glu-specific endopeptidase